MPLSSKQVRVLRAEAHRLKLKPVVMVGHNGLSAAVFNEIEQALDHHELIKVKLPALDKAHKNELVKTVCSRLQAELVQTIGHVGVFFRANPDRHRFDRLLRG